MKLQDLYYGNVIPCQHDVRKDYDYAKRSLELLEMCDRLEKRLSADDKKLLNDITDMQEMLSETMVAESYIQGFRDCAELMIDVMFGSSENLKQKSNGKGTAKHRTHFLSKGAANHRSLNNSKRRKLNEQVRSHRKHERDNEKEYDRMDEKNTKAETNKYAELRRTQYEIDTVVIDGKTFTVINAFPTDTDVTVEDRLRYLVKVS